MHHLRQIFYYGCPIAEGDKLWLQTINGIERLQQILWLNPSKVQFFVSLLDQTAPKCGIILVPAANIDEFVSKLADLNPLVGQDTFWLPSWIKFAQKIVLFINAFSCFVEIIREGEWHEVESRHNAFTVVTRFQLV